ncbi:MAG: glutamine--fructose-6-phosphate transaminase (isomerizing) [Patescibacteria group bacterium]|nr:glutamine--fructose-6-phosphate transaminase (isomerizing) [Patescibacteria group bacterium]
MCGIVAYVGKKRSVDVLLDGLHKLEYRGYDSAGLSFVDNEKIRTVRAVGKVQQLDEKCSKVKTDAKMGIAHTRWATHGKPSVKNAHPHTDCFGDVSVVHNGIIENYQVLKKMLEGKNHVFKSDTDTEVIPHLIEEFSKSLDFSEAVAEALKTVEGTFGVAVISKAEPDKIIAARKGSPLIVGVGKGEYIVASDASAIVNYTKDVIYLEDGEMVELTSAGHRVRVIGRKEVKKEISKLDWSFEEAQKEGFDHFMLKEIMEQPQTIQNAIRGRIDRFVEDGSRKPMPGGLVSVEDRLRKIDRLIILSCGTSYYAGLVGEYMMEEYAGIPTEVDFASEFRYRKPIIDDRCAVLAISQSGETADTLEAIREAKYKGALTLGIVNTVGSTIARETDAGIYNHAGPEIGVASTKAFTSQLSVLALMTIALGRQRSMSHVMGRRIATEIKKIPNLIENVLKKKNLIRKIAKKYVKYENWLYLGRKYNYPIANEGALKLKEISYVHAEGYASGEMKHGPIAMIDESFPSVFVAPQDSVYEKNISNMQELKARGGKIVAVATNGDKKIGKIADDVIFIPKTLEMLTPLISVIPLQLFAYYVGVEKGLDVDKPRNLAKSVTVE